MTKWIDEAKKHIGLKEVTGLNDHPLILSWWVSLGAKWLYKQAWCGLFVAHCIKTAGYPLPKHWYRALDWLNWGVDIGNAPCYGCVGIVSRKGGGHVFFPVGHDEEGNIIGIGANQGNAVSIQAFDPERIVGYRMPVGTFHRAALPLIRHQYVVSRNEA
jgi:uncharacterized protein (TIGR02594 family)